MGSFFSLTPKEDDVTLTDPTPNAPRAGDTTHDRARAQICAAAVAIEFGAPELELSRPDRRGPNVDFARQVAMYLAHVQYGMNHTRIGALFSRDRSTVSHACRCVSELMDDAVFGEKVDRIGARLQAFADVSLQEGGMS